MPLTELTTTTEVIDALGGNQPVAELTNRGVQAVSNWRAWDHFPSNTYVVMLAALRALDKSAPDALWNMNKSPAAPENRQPEVSGAITA